MTRLKTKLMAIGLVFATSMVCNAQSFHVSPEKSIALNMRISTIGPYRAFSYASTTGLVWEQPIVHPYLVRAVRLHVWVVRSDTPVKWNLVFQSLDGKKVEMVKSCSARAQSGEIWSDEIPGRGARIQLWSEGDANGLEILVNDYAYDAEPAYIQGVSGEDKRLPIRSNLVPRNIAELGRPIARLRFMTSQGQGLCTGFLVSNDLLMTNHHCVHSRSQVLSSVAEFGFNDYGAVPDPYIGLELVASDTALDYSIIRLDGAPGLKYGSVKLQLKTLSTVNDTPRDQKTPLLIIEHPSGEPKQVSMSPKCTFGKGPIRGVQSDTDFSHTCDTLNGSSGSPTMDPSTGNVIGLHHFGFEDNESVGVNQAVYIGLILNDIQGKCPGFPQHCNGLFEEIKLNVQ